MHIWESDGDIVIHDRKFYRRYDEAKLLLIELIFFKEENTMENEKIVTMESTNEQTECTVQEKKSLLTRIRNHPKARKVGKVILRVAEGAVTLGLGILIGKAAVKSNAAIPVEGAVTNAEEDTDDEDEAM